MHVFPDLRIEIPLFFLLTDAADATDNHDDYEDKADSGKHPPEPKNVADVVGFAVVTKLMVAVV